MLHLYLKQILQALFNRFTQYMFDANWSIKLQSYEIK